MIITPAEIRKKALRQYAKYLSAIVTGKTIFPFDIRFGTRTPRGDFHAFDHARSTLLKASKTPQRPGFSVELTEQAMRRYGQQRIPTRIFFETETDFLVEIKKQKEASLFKSMVEAFYEHLPETLSWLSERPQRILPYLSVYQDLLKVCMYFKDHHRPGCYIRELPVEVHTKFIETHTGILKPLLEAILPEEAIDKTTTRFTLRFGLKDAEALVRFRPLSAQVRQSLELPYRELALPVVHFADLDFSGLTIVIIENLMTYLTWPAHCGDLAIFGKGFQAGLLERNKSLSDATLLYWGDLDAQGFMILSQLRAAFSRARSFLMDLQTYDNHAQFVVAGNPCTATELPGLTDEEAILFDRLREENRRLEQEHIPLRYVQQRYEVF